MVRVISASCSEWIVPAATYQPADGNDLSEGKEQLNTTHRGIRARAEHALG
ncbi:hypothetical protein [Amycolatopsis rhizosphaerae]|uniref:hypothetical protein n=1 Tax=Amycolatopsis rhizosphaerae TaxID=2053003 RepID=UPI0016439D79|nr:hypothetical protein [Amycolatopsis rhizosphaerae]